MYKHDPDYKNPDLDPEDPELKKEKPPKIYYYKPGSISEHYYITGKYVDKKSNTNQTNNNYYKTDYQINQNNQNVTNQIKQKSRSPILIISLIISIPIILASIIITINTKLKEQNRLPVYEKYSAKIPKRTKSIFDQVK